MHSTGQQSYKNMRAIFETIKTKISETVMSIASLVDKGVWRAQWSIDKFDENGSLIEKVSFAPNILTNAGINLMLTLLAGGAGTAFNNANSYLGVGDSSTAESASQTDLQASTNKLRKVMNLTYPTYGTSQQIVFQSDFGTSDANFAWNEFAVFNASTGGTMLNRKVSAQGTKTAGQTWRLTLTITIS